MAATVPAGPLAVRWHGIEIGPVRAGALATAVAELENVGSAEWRTRGDSGVMLSYHWLDALGNAIVWDALRTPLPEPIAPGRRVRLPFYLRGPLPPGRYGLAVDLLEEFQFWFADVGNAALERTVDVQPRIARRLAARGGEARALAEQDERLVAEDDAEALAHLAPHSAPAPDWARRVLDAHQEGYAIVGGAVERPRRLLGRRFPELSPWAPGSGRVPRFEHPLLCPSLVRGIDGVWAERVAGLPTLRPPPAEPWLFDGRIVVRLTAGP